MCEIEQIPTLILTVGLPRSGKSTWALKQGHPIVNPDAVRVALHGREYVGYAETMVWAICHYMVRALFEAGHAKVILDACNNSRKRRDAWESSEEWDREFVIFPADKLLCSDRVDRDGQSALRLLGTIERMSKNQDLVSDDEGRISAVSD